MYLPELYVKTSRVWSKNERIQNLSLKFLFKIDIQIFNQKSNSKNQK